MAIIITGCATTSAERAPLVTTPTTALPVVDRPVAASRGSLTPLSAASRLDHRGLFGERRAARVGDTLTVILRETTSAAQAGMADYGKKSDNSLGADIRADLRRQLAGSSKLVAPSQSGSAIANGSIRGATQFKGTAASSAENRFNGLITVTVVEVLANGNLRVAGEKQLAVGSEEEIIRFGGVVSPLDIENNSVLSSYVADARIEYRGKGLSDSTKRPGWLSRQLLRRSPT
jgi:flagellar L-ring protein precursor FlgH